MPQDIDSKIIDLNEQGIIPGPEESEKDFLTRAEYCLTLKQTLWEKLGDGLPFNQKDRPSEDCLTRVSEKTRKLYDIFPRWVPLFFSDYQLNLWQGGCAWIFQATTTSPKSALLQLRQSFQNRKNYLGIYKRDELITHELSHVGRLAFEEPKFEEFFAYRSSDSKFRKYFGPIVKSSFESLLFVLMLLMILVIDLSLMATKNDVFYQAAMWVRVAPVVAILAALGRLGLRHYQLKCCFEKLKSVSSDSHLANAALYRLTDKEIIAFGKLNLEEIRQYIKEQKSVSLRWKLIAKRYLLNC